MGDGGRQRQEKGVRPQIRGTDTAHEAWRHANRHGSITPKPHADGPHGHHGQVSGEGNQPLHDQGGVFVRQLHQQQGTLFCFRIGSGD